ncbi:MAG: DUF3667 domain-containing protein [Acidobacteriota bacterium]
MNEASTATCPNCGHDVPDAFCGRCGQRAVDHRRPLGALLGDLQNQVFAFDSRTWTSLKLLVRRPGFLTREYNAGRRLRYLPPVRLYLLISFFFFLQMGLTKQQIVTFTETPGAASSAPAETGEANRELASAEGELAPTPAPNLQGESPSLAEQSSPTDDGPMATSNPSRPQPGTTDPPPGEASPPSAGEPGVDAEAASAVDADEEENAFFSFFEHRMQGVVERYTEPEAELNRLVSRRIPQTMFFLVPLLGLLLKIFYFRHRMYFVEHLVFAVHIHSFTFLAIFVFRSCDLALWPLIGEREIFAALTVLVVPVYFLLALRRVYGQGWVMTLLKALMVSIGYTLLFVIGLLATLALTLALI